MSPADIIALAKLEPYRQAASQAMDLYWDLWPDWPTTGMENINPRPAPDRESTAHQATHIWRMRATASIAWRYSHGHT